jgi:transposase InsO family protein
MWSQKTGIAIVTFLRWAGLNRFKFLDWRRRKGTKNQHNSPVPRSHWIADWERQAIIEAYPDHVRDGYRRFAYILLDIGEVCVSPSTVYRVLSDADLLRHWNRKVSSKGTGFIQPLRPHAHWHIDISYLNISGTFYFLCSVLDGCSRAILVWDIQSSMPEGSIEIILQRALEKYPGHNPRVISDNGPQFIARDFKEYIRVSGMTHVRTSPYYPQSNGKIERWHGTLKQDCIRPKTPLTLDDARRVVGEFIDHYNNVRLHSAIGYITPAAMLEGRLAAITAERTEKLELARQRRMRQVEIPFAKSG